MKKKSEQEKKSIEQELRNKKQYLESATNELNRLKQEVSAIRDEISKNDSEQQQFRKDIELLFKKLEVVPLSDPLGVESELWERIGKP